VVKSRFYACGLFTVLVVASLLWSPALEPAAARSLPVPALAAAATLFTTPWRAYCSPDSCGSPIFAAVVVATPSNAARVELLATLSFDFRTSPGDAGVIYAVMSPDGKPPFQALDPAGYPVESASGLTTTSMSWVISNVPAGGLTYVVQVSASVQDLDGDHRAVITGNRGVLSVQAIPSG